MNTAYVASIDLGSNSFHMVIARRQGERLVMVDRIKQRVRLAEGLDAADRLDEAAMARGLDCLRLFGERLRGFEPAQVRAVGTFTLRRAVNAGDFLERARLALGFDIDIISGEEEARLIYQGVRYTQPVEGRGLVIDIGGGSTELIIGEGVRCLTLTSLDMGCVSFTQAHFAGGLLSADAFAGAEAAAAATLAPVLERFTGLGWRQVLGCSGTIRTVQNLVLAQDGSDELTLSALLALRSRLIDAGRVDRLSLPGLSEERQPVIAAGLAILIALFRSLHIARMTYADSALREGLLYSAFGQPAPLRDLRQHTLMHLSRHYHIDIIQAGRVERTAQALFEQVRQDWQLSDTLCELLSNAARLHELGLYVNFSGYHRHSAWLVASSELPGFGRHEQQALAALVRFHRKGLKRAELEPCTLLPEPQLWRLVRLLRLAVALNRYRLDQAVPPLPLTAEQDTLTLSLPEPWCGRNRLLLATLEREARFQSRAGWELVLKRV